MKDGFECSKAPYTSKERAIEKCARVDSRRVRPVEAIFLLLSYGHVDTSSLGKLLNLWNMIMKDPYAWPITLSFRC